MKVPKEQGAPVNLRRFRRWVNDFAGYRYNVSEDRIRDWMQQFSSQDKDLAARVLDCVDFFSHDQISAAFRSVLRGIEGWHANPNKRSGRWRFVAYSASAGESGDSMMYKFRHANNMAGSRYSELFIYRSDIIRERLGPEDTVVLVDDFVGTGNQVRDSWKKYFGELLASVGNIYLVVIAARLKAVDLISDETQLELIPHVLLEESENVFGDECQQFDKKEKEALLRYCETAHRGNPRGYGNCGLLIVFSHTCPNDSIPILHVENERWEGLFRRYN